VVVDIAKAARARGLRVAVATGSEAEVAQQVRKKDRIAQVELVNSKAGSQNLHQIKKALKTHIKE